MPLTRRYILGIIACALVGACSQPTVPVAPKFSGRLLLLSGDQTTGADLLELTAAGSTFSLSPLAKGVIEAAASADQTRLLYATKDEILLRDLRTSAVKSLLNGESFCLAWSPDGKRFSYKQRSEASTRLYASDLEGKTKLVWDDTKTNETVSRSCAYWAGPDKLVFDRLGLSQKTGSHVKPNTTTLATVSNSVTLADTEKKWSVEGICTTGAAFLRSDQGQTLIAKSLDNLKTANPSSGPCSGCRFVGFAAKSCVPFFIEDDTSTSTILFYLNPTNWQRQRGATIKQTFSPAARMLINSSARLMIVADAPASLLLVNTESGKIVPFFPKTAGTTPGDGPLRSPIPVVWIEN